MIDAAKHLVKSAIPPGLYFGGIITLLATMFKKAEYGFYLLIILIPQPNIWHKLSDYPRGKDFLDFLFMAIIIGIIIQKRGFSKASNRWIVLLFIAFSYASLIQASVTFGFAFPISSLNPSLYDWKNFTQMIALYLVASSLIKDEKGQRTTIVIMALVLLFISLRSYRNFYVSDIFNYDKRANGPFEAAGLGPNEFAAFIVDYLVFFLGVFLIDKKSRYRLLFLAAAIVSIHPLFFAYSRGAYLSALAVLCFYGVIKKRSLLIVVVLLLLTWTTVLPPTVVQRISMTESASGELDQSAAHRIVLWNKAISIFKENPIFGIGFNGFSYSVAKGELTDTHNFYIKTLSNQGLVGLGFLLFILLMAFRSGWLLFRRGCSSFYQSLGFGFMGCVLALTVNNFFGDRFSYFPLGSYFWILWGVVDSSRISVMEKLKQIDSD